MQDTCTVLSEISADLLLPPQFSLLVSLYVPFYVKHRGASLKYVLYAVGHMFFVYFSFQVFYFS